MAIRVYELSKMLNMSNKDLLKLLQDNGFAIASHVSAVAPEALEFIENYLKKNKASEKNKNIEEKVEKKNIEPVKAKKIEKIEPEKSEKIEKIQIKAEPKERKEPPKIVQEVIKEIPKETVREIKKEPIKEPVKEFQKEPAKIQTKEILKEVSPEKKPESSITISLKPMTVGEFAQITNKPVSDVILTLLKNKILSNKNQIISEKTVALLAHAYGLEIKKEEKIEKADTNQQNLSYKEKLNIKSDKNAKLVTRLPVVVVIGHVDHGKTTLLDFIRKTRVALKEKGGITQHLGAYEVKTSNGNIVFLDTPGHEAFSLIRVRGLKIADISILIVAADDGIMPQTVEAIKRAQAIGLPIIVAINKIDKATSSQIEGVKKQLTQYGLTSEDWGGQTVVIPISAKLGTGISELLDMVSLQAQLLELVSNPDVPASGYVLESKLEKGRGFVATVITQNGVLKIGDYFRAGSVTGKINSLVDSASNRVNSILPSHPVSVGGFDDLAQAGDKFEVITAQEYKKNIVKEEIKPDLRSLLDQEAKNLAYNIIIKTDNTSSREALLASISKISSKFEKKINVINAEIGDIKESDIILALDTNSVIYGLHVKTDSNAISLAQKNKIKLKHFDIIYKLLEDLEIELEANKPVKMVTKKIGEAVVLKVFDIKNLGIIAGAQVKTGRCTKDSKLVIWRGKQKVGEGLIKSLQREKKSVKEVHTGFECAFLMDKFSDWQVEDKVECYLDIPAES